MKIDGWSATTLGDFIALKRGFDLPEHRRVTGAVPILGSFGVTGFHDEAKVPGPGVTVGRSGASIGVAAFVTDDYWPLNTVLFAQDFYDNDPRFAYYLVKTLDLRRFNSGSAQASLNRNYIAAIPLEVPGLPEQRRIAGVLGALDGKMEHNRRVAAKLDELVMQTFATCFLRTASRGELTTVGVQLSCVLGGTPRRGHPEYWQLGTIPWINSAKANEFRVTRPTELITEAGLRESATKLLPAGTTIVAITGATMGKVSRVEIETCANQSIVGVLGTSSIPDEFVYYWIRSQVAELLTRQTGAAQQHVNKGDIESLPLLVPTPGKLARFIELATPGCALIARWLIEADHLERIREALLPKLVSGAIRVPDGYDPDDALGTVAEAAGVAVS
jgi:type I restriction enzyme S subunit